MPGPLIFSTHPLHADVTRKLLAIGPFRIASAPTPAAILAESAGAEIIVVRAPVPAELIHREAGLRALIRHGAGLDMIPVEVATEAGVLVANVPGANAVTVAEHVIWTALALLRRFPAVDRDLRNVSWQAGRAHADSGREMSGRRLGILGMGNVGRALAGMARGGFGMDVSCHTRTPETVPDGVSAVTLEGLFAASDIVALCCPLTPQTRGIVSAAALSRMPAGALLINVSRGPVVDETALIFALREGRLGGAAVDVFDDQPLPRDHPFLDLPKVILTPHMAGITTESMLRMGLGVVAEAERVAAGGLPDRLVNPAALPRYHERFG